MRPYIDGERDRLVEDIERNRPDAILVGPTDTRFHRWVWSDPAVVAALAGYQFFAANPDKSFPAELYVRKNLIGLRATLPGPEEGARAPRQEP